MQKVLVTGCAGFIGSHLVDRLLSSGYFVVGVDNFNDYYDPQIKERNIADAIKSKNFRLYRQDILNFTEIKKIFSEENPEKVVHLAARAGVRASIVNPTLYTKVNVEGTVNLLKLSKDFNVSKFVFGSSSSVYGNAKEFPLSEDDPCQAIVSPYGASKRAAEFFVESFYRSLGLSSIILRFFTVYGPRGRPDMAPALFVNSILNDRAIKQFGGGNSMRDYTFIGDIVDGIIKAIESDIRFAVINLGNNKPVKLATFIKLVEELTNKKARVKRMEMPNGDVFQTWADITRAKNLLSWKPNTKFREGLLQYLEWRRANSGD